VTQKLVKPNKPSKSKSGPKTVVGKAVISGNAITHGITSIKLTSDSQRQDYQQFLIELTDHYQPQSPLERMQVERIAMLRTKLRHLYEVETLKLQLAERAARDDLRAIFSHMPHITGVTRGMVSEILHFGEMALPCALEPTQLLEILTEVSGFEGELTSDDDLRRSLPKLSTYLEDLEMEGEEQAKTLARRLVAVGENLQRTIADGESYHEFAKRLLKRQEKPRVVSEPDEHELRILDYVQKRQAELAARQRPGGFRLHISFNDDFPDGKKIRYALESLKVIAIAYLKAIDSAEEALQIQDLRVRSVTLDPDEADRLMRYQTTLERRLSALVGELMLMQERKAAKTVAGVKTSAKLQDP